MRRILTIISFVTVTIGFSISPRSAGALEIESSTPDPAQDGSSLFVSYYGKKYRLPSENNPCFTGQFKDHDGLKIELCVDNLGRPIEIAE